MEETPMIEIKRPAPKFVDCKLTPSNDLMDGKRVAKVTIRCDDDTESVFLDKLGYVYGESFCVPVGTELQAVSISRVNGQKMESEKTPLVRPMLGGLLQEDYRHTMQTYFKQGEILERQARHEEALAAYEEAIDIDRKLDGELWDKAWLGVVRMCNMIGAKKEEAGDLEGAFKAYERSIRADCHSSRNSVGHQGYHRLRAALGRDEGRQRPTDQDMWDNQKLKW